MHALKLLLDLRKIGHVLLDLFLFAGHVAIALGDIGLECLELFGELFALVINFCNVALGVLKAFGDVLVLLLFEEYFILNGLELGLLAGELAADKAGLFLGRLGLGGHAHLGHPEVFQGLAVLVNLANKALVFDTQGADFFALRLLGLFAPANLGVEGAFLRYNALGGEELVDEGGREGTVLGKEVEGRSGLFAGLGDDFEYARGELCEVRGRGGGAAVPPAFRRAKEVAQNVLAPPKGGFEPGEELFEGLFAAAALLGGIARLLELGVELADDIVGDGLEFLLIPGALCIQTGDFGLCEGGKAVVFTHAGRGRRDALLEALDVAFDIGNALLEVEDHPVLFGGIFEEFLDLARNGTLTVLVLSQFGLALAALLHKELRLFLFRVLLDSESVN